ncbi:MAG: DNA-binding protein [Comamonas sp.]|jgi:DNA repair exonuclease SbcCD ATPase subunit|uniref:DNA-binding protein n=1 Tax=Comamonas TaxID=283 RepID=UPI000699F33B|nr:DNA-binding protein [Comamonas thiooxydans]UBQ44487.1 DNA-binding protein [Comamonas thiooxydans]
MARRIATKEDVFTAANELVKAGKLPRITAIHQIIGGGSYTTISNFLKEWESANLQEAPTEEMVLPDFMASEADFLVRKLWRTALDGAEMRVQSEREQLRSREAVINEDMQQAIDMANSNSEKIDQLEDQLAKCKEEAEKLEQDLQAKERALQMVEHDQQALQDKYDQAAQNGASSQSQIDALRRQTIELETTIKAQEERAAELRDESLVLKGEVRDALDKLSYANGQLSLKDKQIGMLEHMLSEEQKRNRDIESLILRLRQGTLFPATTKTPRKKTDGNQTNR